MFLYQSQEVTGRAPKAGETAVLIRYPDGRLHVYCHRDTEKAACKLADRLTSSITIIVKCTFSGEIVTVDR